MLEGKTALITGASRGIGRAIAHALARDGANIAVIYAGNKDAADETVASLRALKVQANAYCCDVRDFEAVGALCKRVVQEMGPIYALVNNAGVTRDHLAVQIKEEEYDLVLDTNLKGAFNFIRHTYQGFLRQREGRILNISSVVGLNGNAGQSSYAASKAGLIGLTKSIAKELAPRGVTVNAIAPGFIDTDMTKALPDGARETFAAQIPLKRLGRAEDVAQVASFLCSDGAAYLTGIVVPVDGGLGM